MKFSQDPTSTVTVRKVKRGEIKVGNEVIHDNVVIRGNRVIPGWNVPDMASIADLTMQDFADYIDESTEIILLGTGWRTLLPPRALVFAMARQGVGFEIMDTPAACRTFNILVAEDRDVAAFLIVN